MSHHNIGKGHSAHDMDCMTKCHRPQPIDIMVVNGLAPKRHQAISSYRAHSCVTKILWTWTRTSKTVIRQNNAQYYKKCYEMHTTKTVLIVNDPYCDYKPNHSRKDHPYESWMIYHDMLPTQYPREKSLYYGCNVMKTTHGATGDCRAVGLMTFDFRWRYRLTIYHDRFICVWGIIFANVFHVNLSDKRFLNSENSNVILIRCNNQLSKGKV